MELPNCSGTFKLATFSGVYPTSRLETVRIGYSPFLGDPAREKEARRQMDWHAEGTCGDTHTLYTYLCIHRHVYSYICTIGVIYMYTVYTRV